ncbi:MAG: formylglycine-generating enzyme family protein [Dysgonamonadaceae bacterium]|jgi:formylglycine-generating enzyme required for sulfatase activity|nr:formylglycine-generating enzyme family protein [Dysgonamonadaceae bacterium]
MKTILLTMTALFMLSAIGASAQVTIGELKDPESFSILELEGGGTRGLRLPQLDSDQRDALDFTGHETAALGLQIFNIDTQCVETWNGVEWIQACYNNTPTPPPEPLSAVSCGITTSDNLTFTAPDDNAVKYEFFDGTASQGKRSSNSVTFATTRMPANISVKYYYPLSFLKPKMLPVAGNNGVAWHHTNATATTTTVAIPDFTMSETQITQAQFEAVFPDRAQVTTLAYNQHSYNYFSCKNTTDNSADVSMPSSSKPAEMINWYDAIAYCNKLSAIEGKELCYSVKVDGYEVDWLELKYTDIPSTTDANWDAATCNFTKNGYRLPTSSEWEYAARGGTANTSPVYSGSAYSTSGSDDTAALDTVGWYTGNSTIDSKYSTRPVKTKTANAFGLYDMSGNVWEWCWNWYEQGSDTDGFPCATPTADSYVSSSKNASYPSRVVRGGSWNSSASDCRVSDRYGSSGTPWYRATYYGFRVVCR